MKHRRRRNSSANQIAQLGFIPITTHRTGGVALQGGIRGRRVQSLDKTTASRIDPHRQPPGCRQVREPLGDRDAIGHFLAEIIHQHSQGLLGKGFVEHLGGAYRRTGITNQSMRHRSPPCRFAEVTGGRIGGVADEPYRPDLTARPF